MIWRFKSNKKQVGAGMNRIIDYRADGSIWLWTGERWSETELIPDAPPANHPPVAIGGALKFIVESKQ